MSFIYNAAPLFAVAIGQIEAVPTSALAIYGPMGIICVWLMYRDEKRAKENEKLRESIGDVAHQMKNLSRAILYTTATSGPPGLKEVAAKELERTGAGDK
jgi:hypothetical protein